MDALRYSAHARAARRKLPRYGHPLALTAAISVAFTIAAVLLLQAVGTGLAAGVAELGSSITGALPQSEEGELDLAERPVIVSAAPILSELPEFTASTEIVVGGRVPAFAIREGRRVRLSVNGSVVGDVAIAEDGTFGPTPLQLAEGSNVITAGLIESEGALRALAESSATVVVDRTPPEVSLLRPLAGDELAGPDVVIEGRTEPGAEITINGMPLIPSPDGSFTEYFRGVAPGDLPVTIVARDRAGNETRSELTVRVRLPEAAPVAGLALSVYLDRTLVRPSETVIVNVIALENGQPRPDLPLTISMGVQFLGSYRTDSFGVVSLGFQAPAEETETVAVVVLGGGTSATATFTVAR